MMPRSGKIPSTVLIAALTVGCASTGPLSTKKPTVQRRDPGQAQPRGDWSKVVALDLRSVVSITLVDGSLLAGVIDGIDADGLELINSVGRRLRVARPTIQQIVARTRPDALTNGALIGAVIGVVGAATTLTLAAAREGYVLQSAKWGAPVFMGAIGAVVGMFVDRAHRTAEVVYTRP